MDYQNIIVSGLPRSGTSLLMQILKSQDIQMCEDGIREPDVHNTNGYFEIHKIGQKLKSGSDFLNLNKGKAIKIVASFLNDLPIMNGKYLALFSVRKFDEIFQSMEKMMGRDIRIEERRSLMNQQFDVLKSIKSRNDIDLVQVNYNKLIKTPWKEIAKISLKFGEIDIDKAIGCIDVHQYNNRI